MISYGNWKHILDVFKLSKLSFHGILVNTHTCMRPTVRAKSHQALLLMAFFNNSLHNGKADHYTPSPYQYHHKSLKASPALTSLCTQSLIGAQPICAARSRSRNSSGAKGTDLPPIYFNPWWWSLLLLLFFFFSSYFDVWVFISSGWGFWEVLEGTSQNHLFPLVYLSWWEIKFFQ